MAKLLAVAVALLACALPVSTAGHQILINRAPELVNTGRALKHNYNDMTEVYFCARTAGTLECHKALGAAKQASAVAGAFARSGRWTNASLHNGRGDAFRHCFWNALMTQRIGRPQATQIANAHENNSPHPLAEKTMDLYNDMRGREIGEFFNEESQTEVACLEAAVDGSLRTCCGA